MSSVRERIVIAVVAQLNALGKPTNFTAVRERAYPVEKNRLPVAIIYNEDDEPRSISEKVAAPLVERSLALSVEARAIGSPSDAALDPVIVWITKQFFVDEKLGGLATQVIEGRTVWSIKTGDDPIAAATLHFTIKYRTSRTDPTAAS